MLYELSNIRIINQRILEGIDRTRMETTISAFANFRGIDITETTTFWTEPLKTNNSDNVLYGEASGILMTKDGLGLATFRGRGLTFNLGNGKIKDRGCRVYQTACASSAINKLSYFDNLVGLFEYDIDRSGNALLRIWEWK